MRRVPLRTAPPADHSSQPGWREWTAAVFGDCAACGHPGRLERHHVVHAQHVRDPAKVFDLRNSLLLGVHCRCHSRHTTAAERLPASAITADNLAFMLELLGEDAAALYIGRYYAPG